MDRYREHKIAYLVQLHSVEKQRFIRLSRASVLILFVVIMLISMAVEFVVITDYLMSNALCFPLEEEGGYSLDEVFANV
ncbi:MAG: hypothetical protein VX730_01980 [Pseudomonadota bacterium]|nr:hypothetical protein [Pseudomonadota bacterium]